MGSDQSLTRRAKNFTPPSLETPIGLQIRNLLRFTHHDKIREQRQCPPLEVSPANYQGNTAISDAMNKILRHCKSMSSYELIRLVSRIRALLVNRLLHGDANDLA